MSRGSGAASPPVWRVDVSVNENRDQSDSSAGASPSAPRHIVAGRGWVEVTQRYRPRTTLFSVLTVLWCFPTAGAVVIVAMNASRWFEGGSLLTILRFVGFDQWIALGLIAAHPAFGWLAWKFRHDEPFRERVIQVPNPNRDPGSLY